MSNTIMAPAPWQSETDEEHRRVDALLAYSEKRRKQEQREHEHPRLFLGFDPYKD